MSAQSEELASRIRAVLGLRPDIEEKRMFGGVAFMLNGNMMVGPLKDGSLLARCGKENYAEALQRPGAGPMTFTGREMAGFVEVSADAIETDEALADWIDYSERFVRTMPAKMKTTSSTMEHLADRIRPLLDGDPRITEKNMFGGLTFLLNGHILVGTKKDGRILLSVGKEHFEEALARPGASAMNHGGRQMTGFVWVEPEAIEDDEALEDWVRLAKRWVSAMPPK